MDTTPQSKRLLLVDGWLTDAEFLESEKRAWSNEFENKSRRGSLRRFSFLAHHYAGEKMLERNGRLDLFKRTQHLPDYRRAEDAVRRGWARWLSLEYGISPDEDKNTKKFVQQGLLYQLHRAPQGEARQKILSEFAKKHPNTWNSPELGFIRKIGNAIDEPERKNLSINDFAHVLLTYWLTGFWWLMPLKAVATEIARTQRQADDPKAIQGFEYRLRKIRTRSEDVAGGHFSKGWNGIFYSTEPPLIACIESNGIIKFTPEGKRMMA